MALKELLLAAIVQWTPPWYPPGKNPETPEQYKARLEMIAEAVSLETSNITWRLGEKSMAAAVLTIWYGETRFAYEVHALGKSRWGQDRGKAKCMGQIHHNKIVTKDQWEQTEGATLGATRRCANATMRMVRAMAHQCNVRQREPAAFARVFAAYGSGQGCTLSDESRSRGRRWYWLLSKLASDKSPAHGKSAPPRRSKRSASKPKATAPKKRAKSPDTGAGKKPGALAKAQRSKVSGPKDRARSQNSGSGVGDLQRVRVRTSQRD